MNNISANLSEPVKVKLRKIRDFFRKFYCKGNERFCPVCEKESKRFCVFGLEKREEAQCMYCGALERHRFIWLFLKEHTNIFNEPKKKMLHVAPEESLSSKLEKRLGDYHLTADLNNPNVKVKMDITDIKFPNNEFDVVYCSHVLEHVVDDRKALREFHRVLKSDGFAIFMVPITAEKTLEDPSIIDPKERLKIFGQSDHVRRYGPDFIDRLKEAGFEVEIFNPIDIVNETEIERMGLTNASGEIFYCTK